jgi:hypothetical protein
MSRSTSERLRAAIARRLRQRSPLPPVAVDAQAQAGEPTDAPPRAELERLVAAYGPWYQRIYLGRGVHTLDWSHAAYHESVWAALAPALGDGLANASVLDVGANAGYFAMQAKRHGAGRVLGLEPAPNYLAQASSAADSVARHRVPPARGRAAREPRRSLRRRLLHRHPLPPEEPFGALEEVAGCAATRWSSRPRCWHRAAGIGSTPASAPGIGYASAARPAG